MLQFHSIKSCCFAVSLKFTLTVLHHRYIIIDAVVFHMKASPLFNIIVKKREVGGNLRAAWCRLLLLYQEMLWQPWCAIFVTEITLMMTFGYFILSLRQLTRLPVSAKFSLVSGEELLLIWSKINTKIEISELVNSRKSWQAVIVQRLIYLLLYCTFEAIFIQHVQM